MSRLPILSGRKVIRALEQIGFEVVRQKGSHVRLKHEDGRVVTVPVHAGQDISRGLLRKILRDAELTPQKLKDLLSI
jgi:predicted RNA binding protein YcfA (HicA-like mRNA interferase family)